MHFLAFTAARLITVLQIRPNGFHFLDSTILKVLKTFCPISLSEAAARHDKHSFNHSQQVYRYTVMLAVQFIQSPQWNLTKIMFFSLWVLHYCFTLHIFSLESQKEDKLKPLEHQKWYFELVGWLSEKIIYTNYNQKTDLYIYIPMSKLLYQAFCKNECKGLKDK